MVLNPLGVSVANGVRSAAAANPVSAVPALRARVKADLQNSGGPASEFNIQTMKGGSSYGCEEKSEKENG